MRKKVGGTMYLISGIAAVVLAIITKSVANNASHHKSNIYFMGKYVGRSSWGEIYDILFWLFLIIGIVLVIAGIAICCVQSEDNTNTQNVDNGTCFIKCPKCGELNGKNNTQCYKCKAKISAEPINPSTTSNEWICPNCGSKNSSYVGTCGCGEVRPK